MHLGFKQKSNNGSQYTQTQCIPVQSNNPKKAMIRRTKYNKKGMHTHTHTYTIY